MATQLAQSSCPVLEASTWRKLAPDAPVNSTHVLFTAAAAEAAFITRDGDGDVHRRAKPVGCDDFCLITSAGQIC